MPSSSLTRSQSHQFGIETLPISIKTITIDGKNITPTILRQVSEENIVDEKTGELRGTPIGHINVHQKDCPTYWHLHVLWSQNGALRQGTTCNPSESEHYQEVKESHDQRSRSLLHLVALLKSQHTRIDYEESSANLSEEEDSEDSFEEEEDSNESNIGSVLSIGQFSLEVSSNVYAKLIQLDNAHSTVDTEKKLWQLRSLTYKDTNAGTGQQHAAHELEAARQVINALSQQSIVVIHPDLRRDYGDLELGAHSSEQESTMLLLIGEWAQSSSSAESREWDRLSTYMELTQFDRWFIYTPAGKMTSPEDWYLVWGYTGSAGSHDHDEATISTVEKQLKPHLAALRLILAEQAVQHDLEQINAMSQDLQKELQLPQIRTNQTQLTADAAWDIYEHEQQQFEEYTSR